RHDRSPDRGEAALYLLYFDLNTERSRVNLGTQWLLTLASGLAGSGPGSEAAGTASALAVRLYLTPRFAKSQGPGVSDQEAGAGGQQVAEQFAAGYLGARDRAPIETLLLAVRASRR